MAPSDHNFPIISLICFKYFQLDVDILHDKYLHLKSSFVFQGPLTNNDAMDSQFNLCRYLYNIMWLNYSIFRTFFSFLLYCSHSNFGVRKPWVDFHFQFLHMCLVRGLQRAYDILGKIVHIFVIIVFMPWYFDTFKVVHKYEKVDF